MSHAALHAHATAAFHPAVRAASLASRSTEQRHHHRARARWPVRLVGAGETVVSGWVSDVSEGGMGLMSSANVPVGSLLETAVAVPHPRDAGRSLAVRAKVRVVSSAFVGTQSRLSVQFIDLPMEARLAIRRYAIAHS